MAGFAAVLIVALAGSSRADGPVEILRQVRVPDHTIIAIRFDHASGTASRVVMDEASGKVLHEHTYAGRPQSSSQEFQDAVCIIGSHSGLRSLIAAGAVAEGGFIVDGPSGHPASHRYIQIRLLSPDRQHLLQVALIDLTARMVASARSSFE
ncbi:hypothetical protein [Bradyrhizobium sp.]